MKEEKELIYNLLNDENEEVSEDKSEEIDEREENLNKVENFFRSGQYDEKSPEEKKTVIKAYFQFLNTMVNDNYPIFETIQQNVQAFTETSFFDEFADKLVNSDLKGEDLIDKEMKKALCGPLMYAGQFFYESTATKKKLFVKPFQDMDNKVGAWCKSHGKKWTMGMELFTGVKEEGAKELEDPAGAKSGEIKESPQKKKAAKMKADHWIKALDDVDPFWMFLSSGEFSDVQKALKKLKDHEKLAEGLTIAADERAQYAKVHLEKIEAVKQAVETYLNYKEEQFRQHTDRRDSDKKQKREQKRVSVMLDILEGMEAAKDQVITIGKKYMNEMKQELSKSGVNTDMLGGQIYGLFDHMEANNAEKFRNERKEDLQDRFLSVQSKMNMGYQPVDEQRKLKYGDDIHRLQERELKKQGGTMKK